MQLIIFNNFTSACIAWGHEHHERGDAIAIEHQGHPGRVLAAILARLACVSRVPATGGRPEPRKSHGI